MTSNKQQTAVEWYAIEMANYLKDFYGDGMINIDILEQAKKMEKDQIAEAYWNGSVSIEEKTYILKIGEQYYNETYG